MRLLKARHQHSPCRSLPGDQARQAGLRPFTKTAIRCGALVALAVLLHCDSVAPRALAQAAAEADTAKEVPAVDPDAIEAVKKMSAYLRSLKAFQVTADVTQDDVLENGLIVQNNKKVDLIAVKPNRMRAEVTSDQVSRLFLYDGKEFTVWGRIMNYYATVPAPPTIGELFAAADEKYDIQLPLVDLFKWGSDEDDIRAIKTAVDLGPSSVEGVTCEHFAFHQEGIDWQIWIQLGDFPLPRRFVITTLTDEARPQHSDTLTWNLAPSFNDGAFVFDPPPDAKRVVLAGANSDATGNGK